MPAAAERPFPPAPLPRHPACLARAGGGGAAGAAPGARTSDAGAIAVAVGASLEHLRPWMPWATPEAADLRSQLVRVAEADELWESGTGFIYVMIATDTGLPGPDASGAVKDPDGEFAGTIGLHRRAADDAVEIGYWTARAKTRRGYATAAAQALTQVALALPGTRQVEIHCDEANTASAGVPRRLGYRLDRVEKHEREAPGEQGRRMIWVRHPGPRAPGHRAIGRARSVARCPVKAASLALGRGGGARASRVAVVAACGLARPACASGATGAPAADSPVPGRPAGGMPGRGDQQPGGGPWQLAGRGACPRTSGWRISSASGWR